MKHTTPKITIGRPYQDDQIDWFEQRILKHKSGLLNSPTGAGKTTVTKVGIQKVISNPKKYGITKVLIAAPMTTIASGFEVDPAGEIYIGKKDTSKEYTLHMEANSHKFVSSEVINTVTNYLYDNNSSPMITTHSAFRAIKVKPRTRMDGVLIIIDECQHMYDDPKHTDLHTVLGERVRLLGALGATVIGVTATDFKESRVTGKLHSIAKNFGMDVFRRTMGEQIRDKYAPCIQAEYLHVEDMHLTNKNGEETIFEDKWTQIQDDDLKKAAQTMLRAWRRDGYPKALFLIPAGQSERKAEILTDVFSSVNFSNDVRRRRGRKSPIVLNGVGNNGLQKSSQSQTYLINQLRLDNESHGQAYDLIIGCRKFDEGTDVKTVSHVYQIGIPNSTVQRIQRMGRGLRQKSDEWGKWFGTKFKNVSKMVYLIPSCIEISKMSYHLGRKLVHTIAATELPEEYVEHTDSVVMKSLKKKKKQLSATGQQDYDLLRSDVMSAEIKGALKEYTETNPDVPKREVVEHVVKSLIKQNYDKEAATIVVTEKYYAVTANQRSKKKGNQLKRNPKVKDTYLKESIDEFLDSKVEIDKDDDFTRVWAQITGADFTKYAEQFKRSVNGGEKEAIDKWARICEWRLLHGVRPSSTASDREERKLGKEITIYSQLLKGNTTTRGTLYEKVDELVKQYGYWMEFFGGDEQNAIDKANKLVNWYRKTGKKPRFLADEPEEKTLGVWVSSYVRCVRGTVKQYTRYDSVDKVLQKANIWNWFIDDPRDFESVAIQQMEKFCKFVLKHRIQPRFDAKDENEKTIYNWFSKYSELSKKYPILNQIAVENKCAEYTMPKRDFKSYQTAKNYCMFIKTHAKRPSSKSSDKAERSLSQWATEYKRALHSDHEENSTVGGYKSVYPATNKLLQDEGVWEWFAVKRGS